MTATSKTALPPGKGNAAGRRKAPFWANFRGLLTQEETDEDVIKNDVDVLARYRRLMNLILVQALTIGILTGIMILGAPIMRPINVYYSLSPERKLQDLSPLFTPNMTDRAILSWAATSVTEIMTIGFGDFDERVKLQRKRFTARGWESFQNAMTEKNLRQGFKSQQLILTTVPSDSPVIVSQGNNIDNTYEWQVEMPVIMTFVTNNNVSNKSRAIIKLTIIRVPSAENVGGIAIKLWNQ